MCQVQVVTTAMLWKRGKHLRLAYKLLCEIRQCLWYIHLTPVCETPDVNICFLVGRSRAPPCFRGILPLVSGKLGCFFSSADCVRTSLGNMPRCLTSSSTVCRRGCAAKLTSERPSSPLRGPFLSRKEAPCWGSAFCRTIYYVSLFKENSAIDFKVFL